MIKDNDMGKMENYENYYNKYKDIYGDKVVIFYQIGKFHEMYGLDNEHEVVGNVVEIASLLNIKLTRSDTSILENSRSNPLMAGFNSVSLDNNVERLVSYGYTVVVVNQITDTKPPERGVVYIQSPATTIDMNSKLDPYIVSIFIDCEYNKGTQRYYEYIGMSAMDITTGKSYIFETNSTPGDPSLALDDVTRFFQTFNPVEIILNNGKKTTINEDTIKGWGFKLSHNNQTETHGLLDLMEGIKPVVHSHNKWEHKFDIHDIEFQEQFLSEYFQSNGNLSILEYLSLARYPMATVSYVYLLKFCADHNKSLLKCLSKPDMWGTGEQLILDTSSILQLGIIENYYEQRKQESVFSLMRKSLRTAMGCRLLRDRLLNCTTNGDILNKRYECIEIVMNNEISHRLDKVHMTADSLFKQEPVYRIIDKYLRGIRDIDRLHRKMSLGTLSPAEFHGLDQHYVKILELFDILDINSALEKLLKYGDASMKLKDIRQYYLGILSIEEAGKCTVTENMQDSIFLVGWNDEIDRISENIRNIDKVRDVLCDNLSNLIAKGSNFCKYKTDSDTGYITVTKAQYKKFESAFPREGIHFTVAGNKSVVTYDSLSIDTRNKSNVKIKISMLDELYAKKESLLQNLRDISIKLYKELLSNLSSRYQELNNISLVVAELDLNAAIANISIKNRYVKPFIADDSDGASYVNAVKLRHPIVERNHIYVPQDIHLDSDGILLYGVNQSGKSCTMKSIGIAVILAQAGFYVPASEFRFYPYKILMTRILGNDNLDKGLSTYAVEMMELRSILTRCNKNSLVLGDEICHGTETASAVSLVAASLIHLAHSRSSFIFATHLHELSQMSEIMDLGQVRQFHLTIHFDGDTIIYDRIMQSGSGKGLYGIEVARNLRLPEIVVLKACSIRDKYYGEADAETGSSSSSSLKLSPNPSTKSKIKIKPSIYNKKRYMISCAIKGCGSGADHTHHIYYQSEADENDVIGGHIVKNHKDNLVSLCEKHHKHVHACDENDKQLVIFGYIGNNLNYEYRKKLHSLDKNIIIPRKLQGT